MDFETYLAYHKTIISQKEDQREVPYDNEDYFNYTKLNWQRSDRWIKTASLTQECKATVAAIMSPQQWIIITEPWCGDAAHVVPFIYLMAQSNPLINLDLQLRDQPPFLINEYLTRGSKSIPKLVIRNSQNMDLGTWGPRPQECQELYDKLSAESADFETVKIALQKWYNADKGIAIQQEIGALINTISGK